MSRRAFSRVAPGFLAAALFATCRDNQGPKSPTEATGSPPPSFATSSGPVTLVGAGNIANCAGTGDEQTANLLDGISGTVFALGDNAYPNGTATNYSTCYNPSWGRHKSRTYPALGNHDYDSSATAAGYFSYYGAVAGDPTKGYYSYELGAWHIIVLNSNNSYVATAAGSPQEMWLKGDLAATTKQCVLAMWHSPRFYSTTSSTFSPTASVKAFWDDLYAAHAALIINAHMHDYERFAPQTPAGTADPVNGIREIIVGTGGKGHDAPNTLIIPNSEVQISGVYGVLSLSLADGTYSWQFIPVAGQTATDAGSGTCPRAPTSVNHPPTAAAGGPYSGAEGAAVNFDGSGSSDPDGDALTYAWSFGDGSTGTGAKPSHAYGNNGTYTVTLTVTDARGAASLPATATATIANVAPSVNAGANQTVAPGTSFTLSATFSDLGVNDAPWAYTITWGDGSQTTGSTTSQSSPITAAHTYAGVGTYTVQVAVTDRDGARGVGSKSLTVSSATTVTLVGAGIVASCSSTNDDATAAILDTVSGTVFTLGDNVYPSGALTNYQTCYESSWGKYKSRTRPGLGNHEYDTSPTAADYFTYFGTAGGDPTKGYYSYDAGAWQIVVLNSQVSMSAGSAQETWLRADLAAHTQRCTLAYWHHPRFSSGSTRGSTASTQALWQALYDYRAEIVLSSHEHNYERFALQTPTGVADAVNGIREFVVGTGGGSGTYPFGTPIANSEVRITGVYGVLRLTLGDGTYSWKFIPVAGQTATDSGSGACH